MTEKLTKLKQDDVINKFVELHGGTKKEAEHKIQESFDTLAALLDEGKELGVKVPITGFGTFTAKMSKGRTMKPNAFSNETKEVAPAPQVSFKKSSVIFK